MRGSLGDIVRARSRTSVACLTEWRDVFEVEGGR